MTRKERALYNAATELNDVLSILEAEKKAKRIVESTVDFDNEFSFYDEEINREDFFNQIEDTRRGEQLGYAGW